MFCKQSHRSGGRQHECKVKHAGQCSQTRDHRRNGKSDIQTADRRGRGSSTGGRGATCRCGRGGGSLGYRCGRCARRSSRRGRSGSGNRCASRNTGGTGRSTGRQRRQLDCRRSGRLGRQVDTNGFFFGLNLAGFLFRRHGPSRDIGNVLSHKTCCWPKINCHDEVSNSYSGHFSFDQADLDSSRAEPLGSRHCACVSVSFARFFYK